MQQEIYEFEGKVIKAESHPLFIRFQVEKMWYSDLRETRVMLKEGSYCKGKASIGTTPGFKQDTRNIISLEVAAPPQKEASTEDKILFGQALNNAALMCAYNPNLDYKPMVKELFRESKELRKELLGI